MKFRITAGISGTDIPDAEDPRGCAPWQESRGQSPLVVVQRRNAARDPTARRWSGESRESEVVSLVFA